MGSLNKKQLSIILKWVPELPLIKAPAGVEELFKEFQKFALISNIESLIIGEADVEFAQEKWKEDQRIEFIEFVIEFLGDIAPEGFEFYTKTIKEEDYYGYFPTQPKKSPAHTGNDTGGRDFHIT